MNKATLVYGGLFLVLCGLYLGAHGDPAYSDYGSCGMMLTIIGMAVK
jgi:hypothetical protein